MEEGKRVIMPTTSEGSSFQEGAAQKLRSLREVCGPESKGSLLKRAILEQDMGFKEEMGRVYSF